MLATDDVAIARGRDEDVAARCGVFHRRYLVALERRLQRVDRVDLGYDHPRAERLQRVRTTLADVAVAGHDRHLAGHHDVGRPLDAVGQRFAATIQVVELALGDRVVDVDRRNLQLALGVHLIQAMDAGGRLLGNAADIGEQFREAIVNHFGQVAAVIQDHVQRLAVGKEERLLDAPIELLSGLAFPGVDRKAGLGDRGGGMVLGRENVAATPGYLGPQFSQRFN